MIKPGDSIDAYKVLNTIGSGANGQVFRVEHQITGREEAMKILLEDQPGSNEVAQRFLREIRVHASLNHPNIVAVHNALWTGEHLLLIMELVDGETLESRMNRGRIPLAMAFDFASQGLAGLACAHEHGIIHGDISPANLLITTEGRLKIMDFGIAGQAKASAPTAGGPVGAAYYMSPEHVKGFEFVSEKSDIYSMGAVLYEMLTGKKVFEGTGFQVMRCHVEESPKAPSKIAPDLPPQLDLVLMRALAKHPGNRYSTVQQFLDALKNVSATPVAAVKKKSALAVAGTSKAAPVPGGKKPMSPLAYLSAFGLLGFALVALVKLLLPSPPPGAPVEEAVEEQRKAPSRSKPGTIVRKQVARQQPVRRKPLEPEELPRPRVVGLDPEPPPVANHIVESKPAHAPAAPPVPAVVPSAPPPTADASPSPDGALAEGGGKGTGWLGKTLSRIKRGVRKGDGDQASQ